MVARVLTVIPRRANRAALTVAVAAAAAWTLPALGASMRPVSAAPAAATPGRAATGPASPVPAGEPWWVPLGFRHTPVTAVSVRPPGRLLVSAAGGGRMSTDGGHTFVPLRNAGPPVAIDSACPPRLVAPAALVQCVEPASLPGVIVGFGGDGVVWRRDQHGDWRRALILLPAGGGAGVPTVTAITAFIDQPASDAVYIGVDGYAVLESGDGGDDWVRDDPGLPAGVLSMATDSADGSVYAGTDDGLWVHHLRAAPAPPGYVAADLMRRRLLTAVAAVGAAGAGLALLEIALGWRRDPEVSV